MDCKMVSLDTSLSASGYALFQNGMLSDSGVITGISSSDEPDKDKRLDYMCKNLLYYLLKTQPDIVVIEMTVVPTNAHTQRSLSEIVGCIRAYCLLAPNKPDFIRLRPTQWRSLCKDDYMTDSMHRKDFKKWSVEKIKRDYGFDAIDDNHADAILIGQAYLNDFTNNFKVS